MAWLNAYLPAEDATAIATRIQALADQLHAADRSNPAQDGPGVGETGPDKAGHGQGDAGCRAGAGRTADQCRADALVLLLRDPPAGTHGEGGAVGRVPLWQGRGARIQVTVALSTLLGLDEQPGLLRGYGALPAEVARQLAGDPTSSWYRLVHDPAGRLLDYATTRYRPPRELTEFVTARDQYCRMPCCDIPAECCELDHRRPHAAGGPTAAANLDALCRRDHLTKHIPGWHHDLDDTGASWWTTPTGHRYRQPREPLPLDHTADLWQKAPPTRTAGPDREALNLPPPF
jgi:hypothetical protein